MKFTNAVAALTLVVPLVAAERGSIDRILRGKKSKKDGTKKSKGSSVVEEGVELLGFGGPVTGSDGYNILFDVSTSGECIQNDMPPPMCTGGFGGYAIGAYSPASASPPDGGSRSLCCPRFDVSTLLAGGCTFIIKGWPDCFDQFPGTAADSFSGGLGVTIAVTESGVAQTYCCPSNIFQIN